MDKPLDWAAAEQWHELADAWQAAQDEFNAARQAASLLAIASDRMEAEERVASAARKLAEIEAAMASVVQRRAEERRANPDESFVVATVTTVTEDELPDRKRGS